MDEEGRKKGKKERKERRKCGGQSDKMHKGHKGLNRTRWQGIHLRILTLTLTIFILSEIVTER